MRRFSKIAFVMIISFIVGLFSISGVKVSADEDYTPELKVKKINDGTGVKVIVSNVHKDKFYSYELFVTGGAYDGYENTKEPFYYFETDYNAKPKKLTYTINAMQPGTYYFCIKADSWENGHVESKTVKVKIKNNNVPDKPMPENNIDLNSLNKGDSFFMGYYEQDGDMTNGREPIEWVVLSKSDTKLLVICKYTLDHIPYNIEDNGDVTWANCTLRAWLNKVFYKNAFSNEEKALILKSKIKTPGSEYEAKASTSKDKVFLLSMADMKNEKLFPDKNSRKASITEYCRVRGGNDMRDSDNDDGRTAEGIPSCFWTLRGTQGYAWENDCVNPWGEMFSVGDCFVTYSGNIRPAMYISLK